MNCIKCGRETGNDQIFCKKCLADMEKYPVKPGTAVKLPERKEIPAYRRNLKRRSINQEDQIRILKHTVRRLTVGLLLCLAVMAGILYMFFTHIRNERVVPGQNYSVVPNAVTSQETPNTEITP